MSVKVYTYDDPKGWRSHPRYEEIKGAIHVCATKNVAQGIQEAYQEVGAFERVHTIREIISATQPDWNSAETQLQQYLKLSKVLKEHIAREDEKSIKDSFRKNKKHVLDTLRLLAYSGIGPADLSTVLANIDDLSAKERMLVEIWHELEQVDPSYATLREEMAKNWAKRQILSVLEGMSESDGRSLPLAEDKIVLHGFYFVTPEQQRFLECVRNGGLEVIFFNLFDERYPDTFGFTRAFITEKYGWSDDWEIGKSRVDSDLGMGNVFLRAYEEGSAPVNNAEREIVAYESFFEFMNKVIVPSYPIGEINRENTSTQIIATNADMLNEILDQYYPDMVTGTRNFLQYPVGQFLSKIHSIRTEDGFMLDSEILMATFTSGWLYDPKSGRNARDYTGQLKKILPYFEGCETLEQWKSRSNELMELYDQVFFPYEKAGDGRAIKSMRSPFARISQFSLEHREMETIRFFLRQLDFISKELFHIEEEEEQIGKHFRKVFEMVSKYNPSNHMELINEETRILEALNEKLGRIEDDTFFLYEDVGEAVSLYLSGKLEPQEDLLIKPFIEVDGEAFKSGKKYYVTGLDERGLPLSEFSLPWPFQDKTYEALSERYQVLELDTLRNKSIKHISRYLFYITLEFLNTDDTELSWMRSYLDKTDMDQALYAKQLDLTVTHPGSFPTSTEGRDIRDNVYDFEREVVTEEESFEGLTVPDFLMEYSTCNRRFRYGYILSEFPTFDTEFHQQFQYTDLLRIARRASTCTDEKVVRQVSSLFPGWTEYRKNMIAKKYIQRVGKRDKEEAIDGIKINMARQDLQLPGLKRSRRDELRRKVTMDMPKLIEEIKYKLINDENFEPNQTEECKYCPFQDICPDVYSSEEDEGGTR
ncbi:hypothetical protein [Exiguobacterium sp. ZOR0005]|uniref:hypothetical protein n=1 Tax=Exiguobacterium sp. ZOR0005 TaxID=1339226 RepID=UPI00068F6CF4|nr:hypothetical protein [Exiguobacterium sp. ZOR0005]